MKKEFITLEQADGLSHQQTMVLHKQHLNSGLVALTGLIGFNKVYKRAEGCIIEDTEGKQYIDFLGGYGALNTGHNHPHVVESLRKLSTTPNILQAGFSSYAAALAANLSLLTGHRLARSFFCNSGAEAVEGALKLARAASGKTRIVFCRNSFHGKTFGALSVTGREKYRKRFQPLVPDCVEVPYGDAEALEETLAQGAAAAFIVEPVQGEGGILVPPEGYLTAVRELCSRYDTLFIADEIQTGLGRTGKMFACEHEEVYPDILCLAKSLSGGIMPIGAVLATDTVYQKAFGGMDKCLLHTSTFGGNAYACTAALAALEVIERDGLAGQAWEKGLYLMKKLVWLKEKHGAVKEVRGKGLMIGLEFNDRTSVVANLFSGGIYRNVAGEYYASLVAGTLLNDYNILTAYTLNNPNVIRIEPPLTISSDQMDQLISALDEVLEKNRGFMGMVAANVKDRIRQR